MRRIIASLILMLLLSGCAAVEPAGIEQNKPDLPFKERQFVYENGITINTVEEGSYDSETGSRYYFSITGMKNKEIENKINEEIKQDTELYINEVSNDLIEKLEKKDETFRHNSMSSSVSVNYNCNNVLFVSYFAYASCLDENGYYMDESNGYWYSGYDLNTGAKLELKDLFRNGVDYKKIINKYVSMYIIKNNMDDPDSYYLSRPFQGIREEQTFYFDTSGLYIMMDEKNDEFIYLGYPTFIYIPIREIEGELAVFDRFYDENINIFENAGVKKHLPNRITYVRDNFLDEYNDNSYIRISEGKFTNIGNEEIERKLNEMCRSTLDADGFRERAKAFSAVHPGTYYGELYHDVHIFMNAGGYLSGRVYENLVENGETNENIRNFNYDLNKNMKLKLEDLFVEGFDYKEAMRDIIRRDYMYTGTADTYEPDQERFYFYEDFIETYYLYNGEPYHFLFTHKDLGYENLTIYN